MAVKTEFSRHDLADILAGYDLGECLAFSPIASGTVQTNLVLQTTSGRVVFRYYENRSRESVAFESHLLAYLRKHGFPCPALVKDKRGESVGVYRGKPFVISEFVEGQHVENPDESQRRQLIEKVAELHNLTRRYRPAYKQYRWNYGVALCRELARREAEKRDTADSRAKLEWLEGELASLSLPSSLPKGICHCDLHFFNVLYRDGKLVALLDFDDANYTFLMFDLVGLIESAAWRHDRDRVLNLAEAKRVVSEYVRHRPLNQVERRHLFDLYKLSILLDCVWYFGRGGVADFYEKRKIDHLDSLGRERFHDELFGARFVGTLNPLPSPRGGVWQRQRRLSAL